MTDYDKRAKIELINDIVAAAIYTGEDSGGPYSTTSQPLKLILSEWIIKEDLYDEYMLNVIDTHFEFKALQIVRR